MTITALTEKQEKVFGPKPFPSYGHGHTITATVRHDDRLNNGHNSFSVTADVLNSRGKLVARGSMHDAIAQVFPELAPYIKWHLCSTSGPLHYVDNSLCWAKERNLDYFRSSAIWPKATEEDMRTVDQMTLKARYGKLMDDFREAVESLGFTY